MRSEECVKSLAAKFVIVPTGANELSLTANENVLDELFNEKVVLLDDESFASRFFAMRDITITYDPSSLRCSKMSE